MPAQFQYRRSRSNRQVRDLCRGLWVNHRQLIQPYFVSQALDEPREIPGLTGVYQETRESLLKRLEKDLTQNGVSKMLLFGVPAEKTEGPAHFDFTSSVITDIKRHFGDQLWVGVDVCLCSYTQSGQCGYIEHAQSSEADFGSNRRNNFNKVYINNSSTVESLVEAGISYAQAGADCVAPSDMMDGRIGALRKSLDALALDQVFLLSYSAKFHSKFYGPFRVAADSAPKSELLRDRSTYQIDPSRYGDALLSSLRDHDEGADALMVKPGLPYLDVLHRISQAIPKPCFVYEVSGEYAAVELMAQSRLMDAPMAHVESWIAFARAGAASIITYGARHAQKWIEAYYDVP